MSLIRDLRGRFTAKPAERLSPAYARRLERNLAKGLSRSEARGHGTRSRRQWETASLVGRPGYEKSLAVLARTRHGESLSTASKAVGIAPDTVLRYVGSAFERDKRGRWTPKPSDQLYRRMRFLDRHGLTVVEPANAKEARKLADYRHAVERYITTGDDQALRRFRRMRLRTRQKTSLPFLTDLRELERFGYAGELSFEDLYQH